MAPWICGGTVTREGGGPEGSGVGTGGGSGPYLSHAGLPDVGGVERQRPVAVDLLWGWRRGEVSPRGPPGAGVPPPGSTTRPYLQAGSATSPAPGWTWRGRGRPERSPGTGAAWGPEGTPAPSGTGTGSRRCQWGHPLPDAHGGLDEGGDAHAGEDGADEVADGELVLAHAQALGQQEGDGDGAAEAGQVMLGTWRGGGGDTYSAGTGGAFGGRLGPAPYLEAQQDAEVPGGHVLDLVEHVELLPGRGGDGIHRGALAQGGHS